MPSSDYEVVVINEGLETRTSASGKQRFVVRIEAEPLVHNFDPKVLGAPVANAIAKHFRERMKSIAAVASPATLLKRKYSETAFRANKPWAMQRYSGGRMGPMQPGQSDKLFDDSGRMRESITANASKDGAWRINVAANRLSGDPSSVQRIWKRLVDLVPEFGNAALLAGSQTVKKGFDEARNEMIKKARTTTGALRVEVAKSLFKTVQLIGDIFAA